MDTLKIPVAVEIRVILFPAIPADKAARKLVEDELVAEVARALNALAYADVE